MKQPDYSYQGNVSVPPAYNTAGGDNKMLGQPTTPGSFTPNSNVPQNPDNQMYGNQGVPGSQGPPGNQMYGNQMQQGQQMPGINPQNQFGQPNQQKSVFLKCLMLILNFLNFVKVFT